MPEVLAAAGRAGCSLAVFNSEAIRNGIDRKNIVYNLLLAAQYRNGEQYSIFMDDDVVIKSQAIKLGVRHIENYDIVTFPVNKYSRIQHAFMVVRNKYLDAHPFEFFGEVACNQCIWVAHALDKHGAKVLALKQPMLQTVERTQLKRR